MKKTFLVFFTSLVFLFLIFSQTQANPCTGGMLRGLVPCGLNASCPCEISDFFLMLAIIYEFLVYFIATPLAVLMLTIGGVLILISAGNPNLASLGKKMVFVSIMGLALVFCAWVIVKFILTAMGYQNIGTWNQL